MAKTPATSWLAYLKAWFRSPPCPCGGRFQYSGYDPGWPFGGEDKWTCDRCGKREEPRK